MTISRFVLRFACVGLIAGTAALQTAASARPSSPHSTVPPGCGQGQPMSTVCAAARLSSLNARLRTLYRAELARTQGTIAERRLIHAENQWRRYANADCMFANGPRREGGETWALRQDACLADHVRLRIARLQGEAQCSRGSCPPPR